MKRHRLFAASAFMLLAVPATYAQTAAPATTPDRFQQMQKTMDQMPQAKTPAEREKLSADHMKLMQEQMTGMRSMMGQPQGGTAVDPKAAPQMQTMQQRMDTMQRMMEQMVQHQQLMMKPAQ
jgi:protein CpxP